MRKASLFSGIGGIDLAAHWAGMETVVFCEREPFPQRVLRKHWPHVPIIDDVREVTREELEKRGVLGNGRTIDIISAGYPCQPFSYAGKRRGAEDDRHLWPEVARILAEIRPRWFVGENVDGHVSMGLDTVLADLGGADYTAQAFVIPAAAVGASHKRDRVFIVAHSGAERLPEKGTEQQATRIARSGEVVADTGGAGRKERYVAAFADRSGHGAGGGDAGNETLADAYSKPRLEAGSPACSVGSERHAWDNVGRGGWPPRAAECGGPTQPRVGRVFDELPSGLDGGMNPLDAIADFIASYPQPALMGQPQYDWEPPRVATGVKNRTPRLKALGNAVDPLQVFPIMYAIKLINDWLREGRA